MFTNRIFVLMGFLICIWSCNHNKNTEEKGLNIKSKKEITLLPEEFIDSMELEMNPYDYDTLLSGGYVLKYHRYLDSITQEPMQKLNLNQGNRVIRELSSTSYPMLFKNIGYIGGDFDRDFVFVKSFGSGNPHSLEIIHKSSGDIVSSGFWIEINKKEQVLLYVSVDKNKKQQIRVYDGLKGKDILVQNLNTKLPIRHIVESVSIKEVNSSKITLLHRGISSHGQ